MGRLLNEKTSGNCHGANSLRDAGTYGDPCWACMGVKGRATSFLLSWDKLAAPWSSSAPQERGVLPSHVTFQATKDQDRARAAHWWELVKLASSQALHFLCLATAS